MKDIRQHFPALKHSTYLDTAASGMVPNPVMEWRRKQEEELQHNLVAYRKNIPKILEDTRQTIASFFNAEKDEVALIPNFSFGINSILEALPKNQKVVLLDNEYPSITWPLHTRNFKTFSLGLKPNLEENILEVVEKKKPDVFLFSVVQWVDGIKIDLAFLKSLKEKYPKLLLIADGTQYLGTDAFDFKKSPIDIMITSAYKWMTAGFGSGFLLFKKETQKHFKIKTIGFNSAETFDSSWDSTAFIKHFEPGHLPSLNHGSVQQAIQFLNAIQADKCYHHLSDLAEKAKEAFLEMGLLPQYVAKRATHSSIFNLKGDEELFKELEQNNIVCSLRGNGIRVSFHYYNNQEDLNHLIDVLKKHKKPLVF